MAPKIKRFNVENQEIDQYTQMKEASRTYSRGSQLPLGEDVQVCECGCMFFEETTVWRIPKTMNVILGQEIPRADGGFKALRCLKCKELVVPDIQPGRTDITARLYDLFLDQMESK